MATRTIRTNIPATTLDPASRDFLEYTLTVGGQQAEFGWSDELGTLALKDQNFPPIRDIYLWRLQSNVGAPQVVLTVPQNTGYRRQEASGVNTVYGLALAFVTAVRYTLKVERHAQGGVTTLTDIDYIMETPADVIHESLFIQVGN